MTGNLVLNAAKKPPSIIDFSGMNERGEREKERANH